MAVDAEVKAGLDGHLLPWKDVSSRSMFGGVCYMAWGKMFAALMEGVVAMKLPDDLRARALRLAGVSPFRPSGGRQFGQWIQFLILMEDDVPAVVPWLQEALNYVASLPAPRKRTRRVRR